MKTDKKQTENLAENGNGTKPLLSDGWQRPEYPPEIPKNAWRHKEPLLLVAEDGKTYNAFYCTAKLEDGELIIGDFPPIWVIRQVYSDRNFEIIENPLAWSFMPTFR